MLAAEMDLCMKLFAHKDLFRLQSNICSHQKMPIPLALPSGPRDSGVVSEYAESVFNPHDFPGGSRRASRTSGTSTRGSKERRQSMSSMTSEEESQHVRNLKSSQMEKKDREGYSRRSTTSMVSKETLLTYIRKIVSSWAFEAFYAFAILSNSICIGIEVHYAAHSRGKPLPAAFFVIDQSYAFLFFLELVLRMLAEGRPFFWSSPNVAWNYLDILINITSVLNLVSFLGEDTSRGTFDASGNVRVIRILRLTRVIRVVRIVKIVRFIRALRSLVYSIFGTMKVLLWSVLLLFMIMYLGKVRGDSRRCLKISWQNLCGAVIVLKEHRGNRYPH